MRRMEDLVTGRVSWHCPHCEQNVDIYPKMTIDGKKEPDAVQALFDGTYFKYKCEHCGEEIEYKHVSVFEMEDVCRIENLGKAINLSTLKKLYRVPYNMKDVNLRIVGSVEELIEKARIFYMEMDDRIIEIMKLVKFLEIAEESKNFDANEITCWITDHKNLEMSFWFDGL